MNFYIQRLNCQLNGNFHFQEWTSNSSCQNPARPSDCVDSMSVLAEAYTVVTSDVAVFAEAVVVEEFDGVVGKSTCNLAPRRDTHVERILRSTYSRNGYSC